MLGIAVAAAFFAVCLFVAFKSPRKGALLCVFLLPWWGLEVDVGARLTAYLLASAALIPAVLIGTGKRAWATVDWKSLHGFVWFAIFAILWSLSQVYFLPEATVAGGVLRGTVARALLQIVVFILSISPVFLLPLTLRSMKELYEAGRIYIVSCYCLAVVGFFQIGIWYVTGKDPLPIGILNQLVGGYNAENTTRSGVFLFEGSWIYRMCSLGGEPKVLGQSLVVALILLLAKHMYSSSPLTFKTLASWAFLLAAIFATQSTSAFGLLAIAIVVLTLAYVMSSRRVSRSTGFATVATAACAVALLAGAVIAAGGWRAERALTWTADVIKQRTIGRESMVEDFDSAILGFLQDQPSYVWMGVGLGNIHLYADPYLDANTRRYAGGRVFFAKSAYLKLIAETGILGLLLFLFACLSMLARLKKLARKAWLSPWERTWKSHVVLLFVLLCMIYMVRVYMAGHFFVCVGMAAATCSVFALRAKKTVPAAPGVWQYAPSVPPSPRSLLNPEYSLRSFPGTPSRG
jgi:O-antigen ligase